MDKVRQLLQESADVKSALTDQADLIHQMADCTTQALRDGYKIVLFGNGGSAADAQHVAGEFVNRFLIDRQPLPALALTTDTSVLTCIGNDVQFDEVFARQVKALVGENDVVIGISTSGQSANVLRGVEAARAKGAVTMGFTGQDGGRLKHVVDHCLCVPSNSTPRIQEAHITVLHIICELAERSLFGGE